MKKIENGFDLLVGWSLLMCHDDRAVDLDFVCGVFEAKYDDEKFNNRIFFFEKKKKKNSESLHCVCVCVLCLESILLCH